MRQPRHPHHLLPLPLNNTRNNTPNPPLKPLHIESPLLIKESIEPPRHNGPALSEEGLAACGGADVGEGEGVLWY